VELSSVSLARPDLAADRLAATVPSTEIAHGLSETLGNKLTAYLAGAQDSSVIEHRSSDVDPPATVKARFRRAFIVALMLRSRDESSVVQAWFTGLNPELDDRAPIRLLGRRQ
jgi:hypothetical protein